MLRVGEKIHADERRKEFERLKIYPNKDINTHKPICFGTTVDRFYSIVSWVDGTSIMDIIKKDVSKNYYQLGKAVGYELKKFHSASKIDLKVDWQDIVQRKADSLLENYQHMNIKFANSEQAKEYIHNNLCIISDRPQVVLHGDFHWNNCVVDNEGNVGIIDFSGIDIGDPWYEFGGILWALEYSESYANGQIDGYFDTPPMEFYKVFKLYVALYAFEHLMRHDESADVIQSRIFNARRMLNIFGEDFRLDIPIFRK